LRAVHDLCNHNAIKRKFPSWVTQNNSTEKSQIWDNPCMNSWRHNRPRGPLGIWLYRPIRYLIVLNRTECKYIYRISIFFCVSQILRKKGKFVHFLFCGCYFLRFKTIHWAFLWQAITNIIFASFIFRELKMVVKNAKIRLPRKRKRIYGIVRNKTKCKYSVLYEDMDQCTWKSLKTKLDEWGRYF
jgi:hypothetical protein